MIYEMKHFVFGLVVSATAALVDLPPYTASSEVLELVVNHGFNEEKAVYCLGTSLEPLQCADTLGLEGLVAVADCRDSIYGGGGETHVIRHVKRRYNDIESALAAGVPVRHVSPSNLRAHSQRESSE